MNQMYIFKNWRKISLVSAGLLLSGISYAQDRTLDGKITDPKGEPVIGASIKLKENGLETVTDMDGSFRFDEIDAGTYTAIVTTVGFSDQEFSVSTDAGQNGIQLSENGKKIEEVIVTGVFDKRTKMESSVAISTMNSQQLSIQQPASAADLLKNVPGVFVNSSLGEVRNVVYSRGVSANTTDADRGYYYVSMQEDGLPVTNVTYSNFGPDYFLRSDATLNRLEAVRGGSAAITGPNAPGGIFNYLSKNGTEKFSGEVRAKLGLESGRKPYYRLDADFGGKLDKSGSWLYNIGGFYRYSYGFRYAGYPLNYGGQVKGNIMKTYSTGSIRLYGKYLHDNNGWNEFLTATDYSNPHLAEGVEPTDSYLPGEALAYDLPIQFGRMNRYDPTRLAGIREGAIGVDWKQKLGKGWTFTNNVKFSHKLNLWNSGASITPVSLTAPVLYTQLGAATRYGTFEFIDPRTNQTVARVSRPNASTYDVLLNNLPGQQNAPNSLLYTNLLMQQHEVNEIIGQMAVNKRFGNMTLTIGSFYATSNVDRLTSQSGISLQTIENMPAAMQIKYTSDDGTIYDVSNSQGVTNIFGSGYTNNRAFQTQLAGFIGYTWEITPQLNFDAGGRVDNIRVKGSNKVPVANSAGNDAATPGADGNPLTIYDNRIGGTSAPLAYDHTVNTFSFSGALNYKFTENMALYARYSNGKKAPDLAYYFSANLPFTVSSLNPTPQVVQQVEVGFKARGSIFSATATPFYSKVSNIATSTAGINTDGTYYGTPNIMNSITTYGIELEGNIAIGKYLSVQGGATLQQSKADQWGVWVLGTPGPADDEVRDFSGNKADNNPNIMLNLTPTLTIKNFYAYLGWKMMGDRPANVANTFTLPSFHQFDFGAGYSFSKNFSISANINNVFNSKGVMSWLAPGGYPLSQDRQGFLPTMLAANPNAPFSVIQVPPRSYYLTLVYKF